jgi:hypothetical protein
MKQINTLWEGSTVVNVQAGGTYNRSLNSQNGTDVQYQCIIPQNKETGTQLHSIYRINVYTDIVQVELLDLRAYADRLKNNSTRWFLCTFKSPCNLSNTKGPTETKFCT